MNIKLFFFALFALLLLPYQTFAACTFSVSGTTKTVSSSCSFDNPIDGIDMGTGLNNSGVLKIAGGTLTITTNQQIAVGSVQLSGGSLVIFTGGALHLNSPIWYKDSDSDGTYDTTPVISKTLPTVNAIRRGETPIPTSQIDCNTGGATSIAHSQCYADADGDTYTNGLAANTTCLNTASCATATRASASTDGAAVTTFVAGTLRDAVNGTDCNEGSNLVYTAHAQCYADADGDTYTNGLAANTTCLNTASCATATRASASSVGAAVATYTAGTLRDAANGADCNEGSNLVYTAHAQCYTDADGDTYTNGLAANTTCLNTASCATTTRASASSVGAAVATYTAGRLRDAATTTDCGDANANARPGQTTYYTTTFTNTVTGLSGDWNCNGVEAKGYPSSYACSPTGCANHYFTISNGWAGGIPACGVATTWYSYGGGGTCLYIAGQNRACPGVTSSTVTQSCL